MSSKTTHMVNHIKASSAILCSVLSLCINCQAQENGPDTIDPYRPAYHFTAPANWLNDPNGLVYLDGEYHMFYQLNPYGIQPGHLSWGHAVSRDLVSWKHQPVAMTEFDTPHDSTRTMIFSGSAVIDSANTSRLFEKGKKDGMLPFIQRTFIQAANQLPNIKIWRIASTKAARGASLRGIPYWI